MVNKQSQDKNTGNSTDRRTAPRVECHYPALVSIYGKTANQAGYSTVVNASAAGLYLHTDEPYATDAQIHIQARVMEKPTALYRSCMLICQGEVVRNDPRPEGGYGVAIKVRKSQYLRD